jgi:hypothetical protein
MTAKAALRLTLLIACGVWLASGCLPPALDPDTVRNPTSAPPTSTPTTAPTTAPPDLLANPPIPDLPQPDPLADPPTLTSPPDAPDPARVPEALRAAHDLLVSGQAAQAAARCAEVEDAATGALLKALKRAHINGPAADAAQVRALFSQHIYSAPPLLTLAADRFMLAPAALALCLRAAWLGDADADADALKRRWLIDHEDLTALTPPTP